MKSYFSTVFCSIIIAMVTMPFVFAQVPGEGNKSDTTRMPVLTTPPTTGISFDTLDVDTQSEHAPAMASLLSAVLPGLGQAYNGKHAKIPVIYSGFLVFGFLIYDNDLKYQFFRRNLIAEADDNPETVNITGRDLNNLRANRDKFRRLRDFNMILLGVTYLLQIADAHIDAHLIEFDLNQDLDVSILPHSHEPLPGLGGPIVGFSLTLQAR